MYGNSPKTTKAEALKGMEGVVESRCLETRNTFEVKFDTGDRMIVFHKTPIIWFYNDGTIRLSSGGWRSRTTMERINQHQDYVRLFTDKNIWWLYAGSNWVYHPGTLKKDFKPEYYSVFYDGIEINKDGKILHPKHTTHLINRRIAKIKKLCDEVKAMNTLPEPAMGDCMICMTEVQERMPGGRLSTFKAMSEVGHIRSHVDEGYIHGSLISNALLWGGFTPSWITFSHRDIVLRCLRRFLKAHYEVGY